MLIVVLIAFVVALTLVQSGVAEYLAQPSWWTPAAFAAYVLVAAVLAAVNTSAAVRSARQDDEGLPSRRRGGVLLAALEQVWLIAGLGGLLYAGYGQWVLAGIRIGEVPLGRLPLLSKLLALLPFVAALAVVWLIDYRLHRAVRLRVARREQAAGRPAHGPWTRREYLAYNFRHHLLFVAAPVLLILLAKDLLSLYAYPALVASPAVGRYADALLLGAIVLVAGGVFLAAPLMLVRIWRTEPMPDGPLRRELDVVMRRLNLRCRDILVWKSGSSIANAGVMGLLGRFRYVLLSDLLLENADPREIKAIFAHEAGHIAHHHILYAAIFAFASVGLCGAAGEVLSLCLGPYLGEHASWLGELSTLVLLALAWWLGFGFISRRFERQSDVVGAWLAGSDYAAAPGPLGTAITPEGALTFAQALERVAVLNGFSPKQNNWRHGSIASRVQYLLDLARRGQTRREIDLLVRRIKRMLWVLLAAGVAATAVFWQLE